MRGEVAEFIGVLDQIAPNHLAESWDNVGLHIGSRHWTVKKIWTALDPTVEVVDRACENDVDLLVTHHPLFFKPVNRIDCETPLGRIVQKALSCQLAIYSAHTNLDSVTGGVNDVLGARIGLRDLHVLAQPVKADRSKLVVFVPSTHVKKMMDTLFAMDTGHIGNYSCCTFRCEGFGTFFVKQGSSPMFGESGTLNDVQEHRIEVLVENNALDMVVDNVKKVHPYETMAYDVYPLAGVDQHAGLGRVGTLPTSITLGTFAEKIKTAIHIDAVKVVGNLDEKVKTVAVCSGSGASLLGDAIGSGAQVYVSGDLGYHTARDAQQNGIGLIDIGHFGSERLIIDVLASSIRDLSKARGLDVIVESATIEADPFHHL
jgi:dinuclear metal center YbgI/SA1388 family protein